MDGYLHGFDASEQQRLRDQAVYLSEFVHEGIPLTNCRHLLEIGCGVGAQTKLLLKKFPEMRITGIDFSDAQLQQARIFLADELAQGRVTLVQGDARNLPFSDASFDGAFVCWVLEHLSQPLRVVQEAFRCLQPGAPIVCTEVMNFTLQSSPVCEALQKYWHALNTRQLQIGGDPNVGLKLGAFLDAAGFRDICTEPLVRFFDRRAPQERAAFLDYWTSLLASAEADLVSAGSIAPGDYARVSAEMDQLKADPESIYFYTAMRGVGFVPQSVLR